MARVSNFLRNAKVNVFLYALTILVAFFSRKVFLQYLGDDFVGLVTLLQQILGFLNLAELGISTAIGYSLYGPLHENNKTEINEIVHFFGYLYRKIGLLIVSAGLITSLFFPLLFDDSIFHLGIVYFVFFVFLFSASCNYFFNYHITLLEADQKEYIISKYFQGIGIIKSLTQIILIYYFQDYYIWAAVELLFAILIAIALRVKIKRQYDWLKISLPNKSKEIKKFPEIISKIKQLVVHRFSFFILTGTDQILIYSFVGLKSVAFYGNYLLIFGYSSTFINKAFSGIQASIGNLVAENNKKTILKVFWEIMSIRHFIGGFLFISLYFLTDSFIKVWIGDRYILSNEIVFFMALNIYIGQIRKPLDNFINAHGIFSDVWAPLTQATMNLVISLILGYHYGILGIVLGTTISLTAIVILWKPFFLFRKGFEQSVLPYWWEFLKSILSLLLTWSVIIQLIKHINIEEIDSYYSWVIFALKVCTCAIVVNGFTLFWITKGFNFFIKRLISRVKNR